MSAIKSVRRLDLLLALYNSSHGPPKTVQSEYVEQAKEHLYQLLDINKQQCSESTKDNIGKAAKLFAVRVVYHWKKVGCKMEPMKKRPYFQENIDVEIVPLAVEIPELAASVSGHPRPSGSYKSFPEKGSSAQALDVAAVREQHHPAAILRAAPRAASDLGQPELATAIRKMNSAPDVNPALAIKGMENISMYLLLLLFYDYQNICMSLMALIISSITCNDNSTTDRHTCKCICSEIYG